MARKIQCGYCGEKNRVTAIVCADCGKKIDVSEVGSEDSYKRRAGRPFRLLGRIFYVCIYLGLIGGVGLCFWPRTATGVVGDEVAQREGQMKIARLYDAAENGIDFTAGVTEHEINAYLASLLKDRSGHVEDDGSTNLDFVNVDISDGSLKVVAMASFRFLKVSYLVDGIPEVGANGFVFPVRRAELGHLPLPGPTKAWIVQRIEAIFEGMDLEHKILDRTATFALKDETLWIKMKGSP